jgi:hypothetical protein
MCHSLPDVVLTFVLSVGVTPQYQYQSFGSANRGTQLTPSVDHCWFQLGMFAVHCKPPTSQFAWNDSLLLSAPPASRVSLGETIEVDLFVLVAVAIDMEFNCSKRKDDYRLRSGITESKRGIVVWEETANAQIQCAKAARHIYETWCADLLFGY